MKSKLLDIDIPVDEAEDGMFIVRHDTLETIIMNHPRIKPPDGKQSFYHAVCIRPDLAVVECTMQDTETNAFVTKVGESNAKSLTSNISKQYPTLMAYQRAFDRAAIAILQIDGNKVYSNMEIPDAKVVKKADIENEAEETTTDVPFKDVSESEPAASTPPKTDAIIISDDEKILVGNCRGKVYGEVKDTAQFRSFLTWVKSSTGGYPDATRNNQIKLFQKLAIQEGA